MPPESIDQLGLETNETAIVRAIVADPKDRSVADLARATGLPQTTVHRTIQALVDKGLLQWKLGSQGKRAQVANLAAYAQTLQDEQAKIQQSLNALGQLAQALPAGEVKLPQVRYYERAQGIKQLIWNTLKADGEIRVYTNAMRRDIVGERWLEAYCMEFTGRGISDKVLCDTAYAAASYQRFGGRRTYFGVAEDFWRQSDERVFRSPLMYIRGETYIYNDILAMYTWESDRLVGCEIQSQDIANTQKSIFDALWSQTTETDRIDNFVTNEV